MPRSRTAYLWRAEVAGVDICYSYENCGGIDYFTDGPAKDCLARGGHFLGHGCDCDLPLITCSKCGNGKREVVREQCDDGNTKDGDGCSRWCQVEAADGYACEDRSAIGEPDICNRITTTGVVAGAGSVPPSPSHSRLSSPLFPPSPSTPPSVLLKSSLP